ncbi:MAG TPA: aldolase/citrate lyase family protein [Vicinamibacterales bacterium]|nr:aldolase/citrate lyase family protein [Vicinamibacterales bacterium]
MKYKFRSAVVLAVLTLTWSSPTAQTRRLTVAVDLWKQGQPAFGVYAPRPYTSETAEKLAANPLYDFVFLNLEGNYDVAAVQVTAAGLKGTGATARKTFLVRIPSIERAGAADTRARVKEALGLGADGVVIPQVRSVDQAKEAVTFFRDANANVWSPANPTGETIAMVMIEDPGALAQAKAIADVPGYSILACGIGSLRGALGGDAAGAEAGTQTVLAESKRAKLVNMLTANAQDVEKRLKDGFLALLFQGPAADEGIKVGRAAAGR